MVMPNRAVDPTPEEIRERCERKVYIYRYDQTQSKYIYKGVEQ